MSYSIRPSVNTIIKKKIKKQVEKTFCFQFHSLIRLGVKTFFNFRDFLFSFLFSLD